MIVVDTSALIAIILGEPQSDKILDDLVAADQIVISAATMAEALIVAQCKNIEVEMQKLIDELGMEIVPVTASTSRQVAQAYAAWGKGFHPAGLNYGDCFAYQTAKVMNCPLLFVGNDFSKTDLVKA
jgi:ribonuclease VapC